mmetsp:Transcript_36692/g.110164  ORF Transcript_36692/g.110164 Transcript_36692/m.110164 type:complete len:260 (-) Transcript_36692:54-833(-)|eukprot:CAMPEP_0113575498 /NCGR_PEP_ID=MMETSP0015_2-20120614/27733_1 /TAXON_ID=2838 /ORGANISM="Odontella" /LENGTH=259 /DNA_ID=CAMNT_0000478747 /DNA_START=199 /DNA_END=978 /DNA_ORIENTATION=+ /assembly_acc=CAM_ASM_000160
MPGPIECRLLPHTGYLLIPATLSAMAWVASMSQDGCDYSRLTGPSVQSLTGNDLIPYAEVGRAAFRVPVYYEKDADWRVPYTEECASYAETGVDASGWAWRLSQVMSFLALAFGGAGSLFLWVGGCTILSRTMWRAAGCEILIACVCQSLALLWFMTPMCDSDAGNSCVLHFGAKSDAAAAALWAISAAAVFWKYPTPRPKPTIVLGDDESETAGMIGSASNMGSSKQGSQLSFGDGYGVSDRRGSGNRRYSANSGGFM